MALRELEEGIRQLQQKAGELLTAIGLLDPVGTIDAFAGATAPAGWLLCQGQAVSRTTYAKLFALIGTTYGAGNGSTTFNLPDGRGRTLMGAGTGTGLSARALGATGGAETHSHTEGDLAAAIGASGGDSNAISYRAQNVNPRGLANATAYTVFGSGAPSSASRSWNHYTTVYGTTAASSSLPPFLAVNFIIKAG